MLNQRDFLRKYNITDEAFANSKLDWKALEAIYADYVSKNNGFLPTGNLIVDHLRQISEVHSLKMRIKDPEHLIEKIIRKKEKEPDREINVDNYQTEITDLIGVRALHLFKDDWVRIHESIRSIWDLHEAPVANVREGDPIEVFKNNGCEVLKHEAGYRSVHYLVTSQPTKKRLFITEIQVRTIFEEGWSEIDHQLRYPYDVGNAILSEYLAVFNRLAGMADEMGAFIKRLKTELVARDIAFNAKLEAREKEKEKIISDLESIKKKLEAETDEKKKLQKIIDSIEQSSLGTYPISSAVRRISDYNLGSPLPSMSDYAMPSHMCISCGQRYTLNPDEMILGVSHCPSCGKVQ